MNSSTKWELLASQDLNAEQMYRFYERAGIYHYSAGMEPEGADKRAFLEIVKDQ